MGDYIYMMLHASTRCYAATANDFQWEAVSFSQVGTNQEGTAMCVELIIHSVLLL
jgi:hypothetical protein